MFSSNVNQAAKNSLVSFLGVSRRLEEEKYLGLPLLIGKNKSRVFAEIRERIHKRVEGWQGKILSQAARGVLIRAVAQAIPTYVMSCFLLPKTFIARLNSMMAKFWWGAGQKKIHWLNWNKLCLSKLDGGQGFRDFEAFNLALLAKQWWRLLQDDSLLSFQILKARYFPTVPIHEAQVGNSPSYLWRSLCAGKEVVDRGSLWRVGSGEAIKIWEHNWVWQMNGACLQRKEGHNSVEEFVAHWIDLDNRVWKRELVESALHPNEANWVMSIPISRITTRDRLIWKSTPHGDITVRAAYFVALEMLGRGVPSRENIFQGWRMVWIAKMMPKVKNHAWKMLHGINPTGSMSFSKGITVENRCPVCGEEGEDMWHVYFGCVLSKQVWALACSWAVAVPRGEDESQQWWGRWLTKGKDKKELELGLYLCWAIWKNRNACLHEKRCERAEGIIAKAKAALESFTATMDVRVGERLRGATISEWQPPPVGMFKINVDAAVYEDEFAANAGVVIRDGDGRVVLSAVKRIRNIYEVVQAELGAIKYGLERAANIGATQVILESDSAISLQEVERGAQSLLRWGAIISDICWLASKFNVCKFSFVYRQANSWAHTVAHYKLGVDDESVWQGTLLGNCNH